MQLVLLAALLMLLGAIAMFAKFFITGFALTVGYRAAKKILKF